MEYAAQRPDPLQKALQVTFVVLLHVAIGYALVNGLAYKVMEVFKNPLEVKIIEAPKPPPPEPPKIIEPPKTHVAKVTAAPPPPIFAPPPDKPAAIAPAEVTTTAVAPPPAPPVEAAAPAPVAPPAPAVVNIGVACPNHLEVRSHTPYPPQAMQMGVGGDVVVEFTVSQSGEVGNVAVARSSNRLFNDAAIGAVAKFHCVGQSQIVRVRVPFVFKLEG